MEIGSIKAYFLPMHKLSSSTSRKVVIFVYEDAQPIDISGPLQAFATADEELGGNGYLCSIVSLQGGPIRLHGGMTVLAAPLSECGPLHTLIVPGGPGVHTARHVQKIVNAVIELARNAERICSVCTGAFLLAQAGLLDGLNAATHWRACDELSREFPKVQVQPDPIWVQHGRVWTSAGVTAGIDLALAIIEADVGAPLATRTARRLVVYMRRPGGQRQFSTPLALQTKDGFGELFEWIDKNLHRSIKVTDLADVAGMSTRTFARHFVDRLGLTPAKALEGIRLERAQSLLATTKMSLSDIARRLGFGREERLRNAFERHLSITPSEWRARFSENAPDPIPLVPG